MILQEGDGVAVIPTLAKKNTSKLAEVTPVHPQLNDQPPTSVSHLVNAVDEGRVLG